VSAAWERMTVPRVLDGHGRYLGARAALVEDSGVTTYAQLDADGRRVAAALRALGVQPGQRVGIALGTSAAYVAAVLGTLRAGAIAAPLNTRLAAPELAEYLRRVEPALVLDDGTGAAPPPRVQCVDCDPHEPLRSLCAAAGLDRDAAWDGVPSSSADGAIAFPTGGTTGLPKAAVWSHGGLGNALVSACMHLGTGRADTELFFSPMYHLTIVTGLLAVLYAGATVRLLPRFDEDAVVRVLRAERVTRFFGTPVVIERILAAGGAQIGTQTQLRSVVFGASRSGPDFPARLAAAFPGVALMTGYGATEFGAVTRVWPDEVLDPGCGVGRPVAGVELTVRDPGGACVDGGVTGEVAVRSPMAMSGYLGTESPRMVDGDALLSGDLGSLDERGRLHLAGRISELVKTGGENVFPAEVERVVVQHPAVLDAVVYGVDDATWGERVECAVIAAGGAPLDVDDLRGFCSERLSRYKVPKRFRLVSEFPRTSTEKLDRQALRRAALREEQPA
jgi:fatty-acyl-CoA synthase